MQVCTKWFGRTPFFWSGITCSAPYPIGKNGKTSQGALHRQRAVPLPSGCCAQHGGALGCRGKTLNLWTEEEISSVSSVSGRD